MIFLALLLVGCAIRLGLALQPVPFLLTHLLADDAYYYFKMGENVARGFGTSFDGIHLTNGYHPLWMGIVSFVYTVFRSLPRGSDIPIHALLIFAAVIDTFTAWQIGIFLKRLRVVFSLRLVGVGLFLFNPWSVAHALNGLESAVGNLLLTLTAWLAVDVLEHPHHRSRIWILSLVAAGTVLGRMDYGLFILLLGIIILLRVWRVWRVREYVAALVPGLTILLGWTLFATLRLGGAIPQSGLASTLVNTALFYHKARPLWQVIAWSVFQWWTAIRMAMRSSGLSWFLWIAIGTMLGRYLMDWRKHRLISAPSIVIFALILGLLGQTFLHGAVRWFMREWYFSFTPILFVFVVVWISKQFSFSWKWMSVGFCLIIGTFLVTNPLIKKTFPAQAEMYETARALPLYVSETAQVGSFNAGIHGYYSGRHVVNLDGLVNRSAYEALRDHRLKEYLRSEHIDYLLDYEIAWRYRYARFFGSDDFSYLKPLYVFKEKSLYHGSSLVLYKIDL